MRKHYLDNIRWITIVLVVLFHTFFYFNNIGVPAAFEGLPEYLPTNSYRLDSLFQYFVYPWFMLLLFIVAGIAAFYSLQNRTPKQFIMSRTHKLIVPSTIGVILLGWIPGSIVVDAMTKGAIKSSPLFIRYMISTFSGTGALWFCQVLFISSLVLLLIKKIDFSINKNEEKFFVVGKNAICLFVLFFLFWGFSKILILPFITCYRFGFYTIAFLAGYYIFSQEKIIQTVEKFRFISLVLMILSLIFYIKKSYGTYYADDKLLKTWYTNLYAYFSVLTILGFSTKYLNFSNPFTQFCSKNSFAVYVLHIPVLLVSLRILSKTTMSLGLKYFLLFFVGIFISTGLGLIIKRIPILRYIVLGETTIKTI